MAIDQASCGRAAFLDTIDAFPNDWIQPEPDLDSEEAIWFDGCIAGRGAALTVRDAEGALKAELQLRYQGQDLEARRNWSPKPAWPRRACGCTGWITHRSHRRVASRRSRAATILALAAAA